ncbi:MAG: VTT domain-containing protein [Methanoregula sp.]|uniref:VTT domain-containing protein n=1 Tax=Methanoregula sp. TaxID=2052170 RepID=UPI003BB15EAF
MDLSTLFYFIIHIDKYLPGIIQTYGFWTYLILFVLIFSETGFVVFPFLPGDSLLFIAGAFASSGDLNVGILIITIWAAAVLGDSANYLIAKTKGMGVLEKHVKKSNLDKTEAFFSRYGGLTIIIARFIPYIRTVAPFLAGVGRMNYRWFITYNVVGAVLWSCTFILAGYFVGSLPIVQEHFNYISLAVLGITILIVGSIVVGFFRKKNDQTDKMKGK